MHITDEENVIEKLVEEVVNEVLRGFNLAKFKSLPGIDAKIQYAGSILPNLGAGSSRIVFALSGGKALKIARNSKGYAQNAAEMELWTSPQTKPVIAKIFEADTQKHEWIIAEIVKPFNGTRQEWEAAVGFDFLTFSQVVKNYEEDPTVDLEQYLAAIVKTWSDNLKRLISMNQQQSQMYVITQRRLRNYLRIYKSPIARGVMQLVSQGLVAADLASIDMQNTSDNVIGHYGKTIDGRIVLLDYGYSQDVWKNHYDKDRANATKDPTGVGPAASSETPPDEEAVIFHSASQKGLANGR